VEISPDDAVTMRVARSEMGQAILVAEPARSISCAVARYMLIAAAGARWKVPATQCRAHNSMITHHPSGRILKYGDVAQDAAKIRPPAQVRVKPPARWTLAGKPRRRVGIYDKVTGQPVHAIDVPASGHALLCDRPLSGLRRDFEVGQQAFERRGPRA
jgi:CO/xanthine dehydrogenase Mo-binding subunit